MSTIKSDIVEPSSSLNTKDPTERLNNFDLRLKALSQDLNDYLVCITRHHDANNAQFDSITASVSNLNSICETPRKSNFLKNGKMVISVKIRNFSKSRMTKRTSPLESSREI